MRFLFKTILVFTIFVSGALSPASSAQDGILIVFNKPGANWAERTVNVSAVQSHGALYRRMADEGVIMAGGRFEGEPVLGMSIICTTANTEEMRTALLMDPAVQAGIVAIEFRTLHLQMGELSCK